MNPHQKNKIDINVRCINHFQAILTLSSLCLLKSNACFDFTANYQTRRTSSRTSSR
jgi:hypothetical protein